MRFDTSNPPGNEGECVRYIHQLLVEAEIETQLVGKSDERPNLVARLPGRNTAPPLLWQGHVDVVPVADQTWAHPPFSGEIVDGYMWGRGTLDMKGGVAMMVSALLGAKKGRLVPAGDIILTILSDEERGAEYGAKYLVEEQAHLFDSVQYAIGEFGGFTLHAGPLRFYPIQVAEKQAVRLKATIRGRGGHGTLSLRGDTMAQLGQVLQTLDTERMPVHITPVIGQMLSTIISTLPEPFNNPFKQLLDPTTAHSALETFGTRTQAYEPLLTHTVNCMSVKGNIYKAELTLNGLILPGFSIDEFLGELRQLIGETVELEITKIGEPTIIEPDMGLFDTLAGILKEADPGGIPLPYIMPALTDGRWFAKLGIQPYGFMPMKLPAGFDFWRYIHSADERVPVSAIEFGMRAFTNLIERYDG